MEALEEGHHLIAFHRGAEHEKQRIEKLGGGRREVRMRRTAAILGQRGDVHRLEAFLDPVVEGPRPAFRRRFDVVVPRAMGIVHDRPGADEHHPA